MRAPSLLRVLVGVLGVCVAPDLDAQETAFPLGPSGFTATVEGLNSRVLTARAGTVLPQRAVGLAGLRASFRRAGSRLAVTMRARQSTLENDLAYGDVSTAFALSALALEAGYGWRRGYDMSTGLAHGDLHHFGRVGSSWRVPLTATPITLEARFALLVPIENPPPSGERVAGWDGETGVRYEFTRLPVDAIVGYRFERFRVHRTEQEISAVQVGFAWRGGSGR